MVTEILSYLTPHSRSLRAPGAFAKPPPHGCGPQYRYHYIVPEPRTLGYQTRTSDVQGMCMHAARTNSYLSLGHLTTIQRILTRPAKMAQRQRSRHTDVPTYFSQLAASVGVVFLDLKYLPRRLQDAHVRR